MLREDEYSRRGKVKGSDIATGGPVPWSLMPGRVICDEVHRWKEEMDEFRPVTLDWNKLLPGKAPAPPRGDRVRVPGQAVRTASPGVG